MGGLRTISIIVAANIKGLEKSMGKANKTVATFASKAARVGSMLTFALTAPIVAMGKAAMDTFVNFEQSMAKVQAVTGATVQEFAMLTDEAKRLGATTVFTAQQFSDLQMVLGRKGFRPDAIKDMTGAISDLALATGEDLTLAAETVSSSINAFGLEASQAGSVANTLASAAANSSLSLGTFSTAFGHAGASAKAVGVDIEELSAMMGVLMDNGIKASKSGTGLRKIFGKLNEQGIPFAETLDHLASGQMTLNQAQKLVGVTAANQLIILAKNKDKLSELTEEYKTNTGRLKEMADMMGNTTFAKLKKFTSAMEGLRLEFGKVIAEALMPFIEVLTKLAGAFGRMDDTLKFVIVGFSGLVAIAGPLLLIIGGLSSLMPILATGIGIVSGAAATLSGVLLPILAVIAAVTVLGLIFQNFIDNRSTDGKHFSNFIEDLEIMFLKFGKWLLEHNPMDILVGGINKGLKFLGVDPLIDQSTEKIKGYTDAIAELEKKQASRVPAEYVGLIESAGNAFNNVKDAMSDFFSFDSGEGEGEESGKNKAMGQKKSPFDFSDEYEKYLADLERAKAATQRWNNSINALGVSMANTFASSFADVIVSGENLLDGLGNIFKDLGKQILAMIVKAAILAAIFSMIPGLGTTSAGNAAFGGATGFGGILQNMMGSGLSGRANGGPVAGNRPYLVGEQGPELFMSGASGTIIPNHAMGGGTSIPDVRISGNDLLIVFDRANRRQNRR
jgi:hypothetical protein